MAFSFFLCPQKRGVKCDEFISGHYSVIESNLKR